MRASENRFRAPVLDRITEARVFEIMPCEIAGHVEIVERCDDYFSAQLSADDLAALGAELIAIADKVRAEPK